MNKKEKTFLENNLYENELRKLRLNEALKNTKSKLVRMQVTAAKAATEEAAYICRNFGLDVEGIRARARESFELGKGYGGKEYERIADFQETRIRAD